MGAVRGQIRKVVLLFKYLLRFIKKPLYIKKPFLGNKCHNICNANTKCKKELDLVRGKDMRAVNGTVFCFYCNVGQSSETRVIHNIWQCFRGYTKKKLWKAAFIPAPVLKTLSHVNILSKMPQLLFSHRSMIKYLQVFDPRKWYNLSLNLSSTIFNNVHRFEYFREAVAQRCSVKRCS